MKNLAARGIFVGVILSVLILSGCGGKTEGTAASGSEVIELNFWDMLSGKVDYPLGATALAEKISQKYPNLKINYQSVTYANRYETFTTAIASKTAPDFSTGGGYQSFQFAGAGEILDIGSVVDEWREEGILDQYDPDMITYFQFKGVQVGIPWQYTVRYIIYRSDWFERDGIPAPKTWDDIYNAAVHFTDKANGVYGIAYPTHGSGGNVLFNAWVATNSGGFWTEDGQNPDWTKKNNLEVIEFLRKLRDAGVFPEGMASYEDNEVVQLGAQGKAAMILIGGGNMGALLSDAGLYGKFKILPVPEGPSAKGTQGYIAAINAIMAYSQTKHPEETKQALKWWSENIIELWSNKDLGMSGMPLRKDWLADPAFLAAMGDPFVPEYIRTCIDQTHTLIYPAKNIAGWLTQNAYDGERWWTALSQAALIDPRSGEEILNDFQERAVKLFADFAE